MPRQPPVREQNSPQFTAERCSSSLPLGNVVQSTMYRAILFNVANSIFQIQLSWCKTLRCLQQTIFFMNYSICHRFESDCPSVSGWYSSAGRAILFTHRVYDTIITIRVQKPDSTYKTFTVLTAKKWQYSSSVRVRLSVCFRPA